MLLSQSGTVVLLVFITPLSSHIPFRPSAQENVELAAEKTSAQDMPPPPKGITSRR